MINDNQEWYVNKEGYMNRTLSAAALFFGTVGQALAGSTNSIAFVGPSQIPTLDDLGLTVLTLVVAIAGGIAVRRRKKK
jgi:hypothetical protein